MAGNAAPKARTSRCRLVTNLALWRLLPAVVVAAVLAVAVWDWTSAPNQCVMSYSRPVYTPVPVPSRLSYKYRLMRYTHGHVERPLRVTGMPVLYVPGHLGSYKQARSFASAAVVASQGKGSDVRGPVEYFALDFGEEWSGLVGHVVWDQAEFINDAVRTIRVLYARTTPGECIASTAPRHAAAGPHPPPSAHAPASPALTRGVLAPGTTLPAVTIVAHSLGGIAARAAYMLTNHRAGSMPTLVTLSSPHQRCAPPCAGRRWAFLHAHVR